MNAPRKDELAAYFRAVTAIHGLIRGERFGSRTASQRRVRAEAKLARVRSLLSDFQNPQDLYPIVHVTGTSGKGSTSAAIASILTAAGYRVGLRTSPYLQVATEKLQIGPALMDAVSFDRLSHHVLEEGARQFPSTEATNGLGYAELWSVMSMLWFAERNVDIAVVEVGAGGRFDTTNTITPAVSVITSVGIDHVTSLGPSIADIAWHKAGIIKRGSTAVVGDVPRDAFSIIEVEAASVGARIRHLDEATLPDAWHTAMKGDFQRKNAKLAVTVVDALRDKGFAVSEAAIAAGLAAARLPGRLEKMPGFAQPEVWIDGAHNADKIAALARAVKRLSAGGPLPVIVLGMLGTKDASTIAGGLTAVASAIVTTQPEVIGKQSRDPRELARIVEANGFTGPILVDPKPASAVRCAEQLAGELGANVLVTGSMYLAGEARRRWYPDDEIVVQRTSWPSETIADSSCAP